MAELEYSCNSSRMPATGVKKAVGCKPAVGCEPVAVGCQPRSSRVPAWSSRELAIVFPSVLTKDWCQEDIGACVFGRSCVF